jgi:hypothetical protein
LPKDPGIGEALNAGETSSFNSGDP